jgi:hypothetical protein
LTKEPCIQTVLEGQADDGAFLSFIDSGARTEVDRNGFATALVLRALARVPETPSLSEARTRALDFLQSCESPDRAGAFGFWPRLLRPAWGVGMTEDADDTAVIALELFRHGRLSRQDIRRIVCRVLFPYRLGDGRELSAREPSQPWVRRGVFLTWLHRGVRFNPIDCCVNANVVALMSAAGLSHLPGYAEAYAMIRDGIRRADGSWDLVRALVPYYPDAGELIHALRHAVECGAEACAPALRMLRDFPPAGEPHDLFAPRPICGSSDGRVVWTSPVLAAARWIGDHYSPAEANQDARQEVTLIFESGRRHLINQSAVLSLD